MPVRKRKEIQEVLPGEREGGGGVKEYLLAHMYACVARVEAMKAENSAREMRGESQAYTENDSAIEAGSLDNIAIEMKNQ